MSRAYGAIPLEEGGVAGAEAAVQQKRAAPLAAKAALGLLAAGAVAFAGAVVVSASATAAGSSSSAAAVAAGKGGSAPAPSDDAPAANNPYADVYVKADFDPEAYPNLVYYPDYGEDGNTLVNSRPEFAKLPLELTAQTSSLDCSQIVTQDWITEAPDWAAVHEEVALFMNLGCSQVMLVDPTGQTLKGWDFGGQVTNAIMNPDTGSVSALILCVCDFLSGIAPADPAYTNQYFIEQSWDGEITFQCTLTLTKEQQDLGLGSHHLMTQMPNGNFLVTFARNHSSTEECMGKYGFDNGEDEFGNASGLLSSDGCVDDGIIEIKYNPDQTSIDDPCEITWSWWSFDHSVQEGHTQSENYGQIDEHPELISLNYFYPPRTEGVDYVPGVKGEHEPMHFNSITYYEELDIILIGSFYKSEFYIIDHSTTTEEAEGSTGGNFGMGGDILYRYGNPEVYGQEGEMQFRVAHGTDIQKLDDGSLQIVAHENGLPYDGHGACDKSGIFTFTIPPPSYETGFQKNADGKTFAPEQNDFKWLIVAPDMGENATNTGNMCSFDLGGARFAENGNYLMTFPGEVGMDNSPNSPYDPEELVEVTPNGEVAWRMQRNYWAMNSMYVRGQLYQTEFYPRSSPAFQTYGVVRD